MSLCVDVTRMFFFCFPSGCCKPWATLADHTSILRPRVQPKITWARKISKSRADTCFKWSSYHGLFTYIYIYIYIKIFFYLWQNIYIYIYLFSNPYWNRSEQTLIYNNPTWIQWILNLNIKQPTKVALRGVHWGINASESKLEGELVETKPPMSGLVLEDKHRISLYTN